MSAALLPDLDLDCLDDPDLVAAAARKRWLLSARTAKRGGKQLPPTDLDWEILLFLCGRGFGKTVALSQWLWWETWSYPGLIGHYIAPTLSDVRGTSFEGPAGLLSVVPPECMKGGSVDRAYNRTLHELRLSNGSLIRGFGAVEEAGRLRGPQCQVLACDELREWDKPVGNLELAMNNALFGLRLPYPDGTPARAVFGTTSKPIPYLKRLINRPNLRIVRGTSYENMENLSPTYRSQLLSLEGTLIGKQEIHGLFIDEESDLSIIKRHWIKLWPAEKKLPEFLFLMEAYDTASSEENYDAKHQTTDPSGSIVLGVFNVAQCFPDPVERKKLGVRGRYAALLCEAWTERLGLPELLEKARAQHRIKWGSPGRRADVVLIEDKSSGPGMRQFMRDWGVPVWPYHPRQDKATRLHAISPILAQGGLFVPESMRADRKGLPRDWVEPLLEQLCAFAGKGSVEHDEFVDCISSAFAYLRERNLLDAEPDEKHIDYEAKIEADREEAARIRDGELRREKGNPYS